MIGSQFLRWFRVERKNSVVIDGRNSSTLIIVGGRKVKWTAVEDSKLKDAVQTHDGQIWDAIAALMPGRTRIQCRNRWKYALDPNTDRANERTVKWTAVEDSDLKDSVQTHGDKNWGAITRVELKCSVLTQG
jgi:hypothetical protein